MPFLWKSHVVVSGSMEHALLASASMDTPRTRRQLRVIALQNGLKFYDNQTVVTALKRLSASGLLTSSRKGGYLLTYHLTPQGKEVLQALAQT